MVVLMFSCISCVSPNLTEQLCVYPPWRTSSGPSRSQPFPPNHRGLGWISQSSTARNQQNISPSNVSHKSVNSRFWQRTADLVEAEQTPGRRRCSRCSSIVYGAHTLSQSGSLEHHRLSLAASAVEVDTGRSSGAVRLLGGWGSHSPETQTCVWTNVGLRSWFWLLNVLPVFEFKNNFLWLKTFIILLKWFFLIDFVVCLFEATYCLIEW